MFGCDVGGQGSGSDGTPVRAQPVPYVFTRITGFPTRRRHARGVGGGHRSQVSISGIWVVFSDKLPAVPAQAADFLGLRWDARTEEVQVPEERRAGFKQEVQYLLSGGDGGRTG